MLTLIFTLLVTFAHAADDSAESGGHAQEGWVVAVGTGIGTYALPTKFAGDAKNFNDAQAGMFGPQLSFGRDWLLRSRWLIGARVEGYYLTDFGRENRSGKFYDDKTNLRFQGGHLLARGGMVFPFKTKNPLIGEMLSMQGEVFFEAGMGTARSTIEKKYSFDNDTIDESYDARFEQKITTGILAVGVNIVGATGYFLELKLRRTTMWIDEVKETTSASFTDGTTDDTDVVLRDLSSDPIYLSSVVIGTRY